MPASYTRHRYQSACNCFCVWLARVPCHYSFLCGIYVCSFAKLEISCSSWHIDPLWITNNRRVIPRGLWASTFIDGVLWFAIVRILDKIKITGHHHASLYLTCGYTFRESIFKLAFTAKRHDHGVSREGLRSKFRPSLFFCIIIV